MNKDKQQTAVDWYAEEHLKLLIQLENKELSLGAYVVKHSDILKQAKQMEKEQMKESWFDSTLQFDNAASMVYKKEFEQYYRETYGED